jgi:hypothetical protein
MKCSHGLPYESKCRGCFEDAMKRISASRNEPKVSTPASEAARERFFLGVYQKPVDVDPRLV